ncbi:hypothetical protein HOH87_06315 [bacterium]|jgi:hypothetical protein|nr:hypothetical protein [bacterium]
MVYNLLTQLIRKQFYITSNEKYTHAVNKRSIERFTGKHPLLTPELIIVNDQPYGFKRLNRRLKSLEKFPIQCEFEYLEETNEEFKVVENFDLYTEIATPIKHHVNALENLVKANASSIIVERVKRIGSPEIASLLIYSRLGELFMDHFYEEELDTGMISEPELTQLFSDQINHFITFIKSLDTILQDQTPPTA